MVYCGNISTHNCQALVKDIIDVNDCCACLDGIRKRRDHQDVQNFEIAGTEFGWPNGNETFLKPGYTNSSVLVERFSELKHEFAKILEVFAHGTLPGGLKLSDRYISLWHRMSSSRTEWYSCYDPIVKESDLSDVVDILGGQQCYRKNVNECELLRGLHVSSIVALVVAVGLTVASMFLPSFKSKAIALVIAVLVMFASLTPIATIVIERERALAPFFDVTYVLSLLISILGLFTGETDSPSVDFEANYPDSTCGYSWPILIERLALRIGEDFAASRPSVYEPFSDNLFSDIGKFLDSDFLSDAQTTTKIGNLFEAIGYDVQYAWGYYLNGVTIAVGTIIWATVLFFTMRTSGYAKAPIIFEARDANVNI